MRFSRASVAALATIILLHTTSGVAGVAGQSLCGTFQIPYDLWRLRPSNQTPATYKYTCGSTNSQHLYGVLTDLQNGLVLLTAGQNGFGLRSEYFEPTSQAELYDVVAGRFASTPAPMLYLHGTHTATRLPNRQVLIIGTPPWTAAAHAELYNPKTLSFEAPAGDLLSPRYSVEAQLNLGSGLTFTTTSMGDGRVLVAGPGNPSAEIYDSQSNRFTATGPMLADLWLSASVLLPNGKVLIVGGASPNTYVASDFAEIYDPATGAFSSAGAMTTPRARATATMLQNGKVLIAGGDGCSLCELTGSSAELYDPVANVFTRAGAPISPIGGPAIALASGKVLFPSASQIYDPVSDTFGEVAGLLPATSGGTAQLRGVAATNLQNGQVLVVGGGPNSLSGSPPAGVQGQLYQP